MADTGVHPKGRVKRPKVGRGVESVNGEGEAGEMTRVQVILMMEDTSEHSPKAESV